jgi:hypothetical protein
MIEAKVEACLKDINVVTKTSCRDKKIFNFFPNHQVEFPGSSKKKNHLSK